MLLADSASVLAGGGRCRPGGRRRVVDAVTALRGGTAVALRYGTAVALRYGTAVARNAIGS